MKVRARSITAVLLMTAPDWEQPPLSCRKDKWTVVPEDQGRPPSNENRCHLQATPPMSLKLWAATGNPKRIHTVQFLSHGVYIEGLPLWGENHLWCQAGMIALGKKETQDESWKAQESCWDSAALLRLGPWTYPTGVCNWRTFIELDAYELHTFLHLHMLTKSILKVDAVIFFVCMFYTRTTKTSATMFNA